VTAEEDFRRFILDAGPLLARPFASIDMFPCRLASMNRQGFSSPSLLPPGKSIVDIEALLRSAEGVSGTAFH
jgi:hypothetical protein